MKPRSRAIGKLAPGFLVASPSLLDSNFSRSVVLLVEHGEGGSIGFVVNRPSNMTFDRVVASLGLGEEGGEEPVAPAETDALAPFPLYVGGPVAPQSGWILFDPRQAAESDLADALLLSDRVALSASRALLERMVRASSFPGARLLAMGYAGWGGGQLDDELERGVWLPASLNPEVLFEVAPEDRWAAVLRSEGIEPGRVVSPVQSSTSPKNVC